MWFRNCLLVCVMVLGLLPAHVTSSSSDHYLFDQQQIKHVNVFEANSHDETTSHASSSNSSSSHAEEEAVETQVGIAVIVVAFVLFIFSPLFTCAYRRIKAKSRGEAKPGNSVGELWHEYWESFYLLNESLWICLCCEKKSENQIAPIQAVKQGQDDLKVNKEEKAAEPADPAESIEKPKTEEKEVGESAGEPAVEPEVVEKTAEPAEEVAAEEVGEPAGDVAAAEAEAEAPSEEVPAEE